MKLLLLFLFSLTLISPTSQPFKFSVVNYTECQYKVTLKGYNNNIYKIIYVNAKKSKTITGSVPYPYFKVKFEKTKNIDCGCTNQQDAPYATKSDRLWKNGDNFEVFTEINSQFNITRKKCSRV